MTRHTIWSLTIGGAFTWTAIYAVNQAMVQRALSCRTLKIAQLFALNELLGIDYFQAIIGLLIICTPLLIIILLLLISKTHSLSYVD